MPASGASRKTPEPNMQRKEKLREVLCWQAETTVSYVPEGKRAGTASFVRYERYSKATTVGEALQLGSSAEDLINDYMKGILKVTGGPKREKPLELEEVTRGEGLTETDKQLGKFLKNFHRVELASQLASETGVDPKALTSKRSWCESPVMHAKRTFAQRAAEEVLKQVEESGGKVTDEHVLDLLRKWAFRRNATRRNVAPADRPVVDSDTFGVMRNQAGVWIVTHATRDYPAVTKLLMRWLLDTLPLQDVCITSIHVNSGFAARRHRDRDNLGPTFMRALGDFSEGGQLWYWPDDDGVAAVERLPEELRVTLDMRAAPAIIDGKRAHEVEPFKGERFGIVFYTANNSQKIPKAIADELATYGLRMPDKEGIEAARHFFTAPKGYGLEPAESTGPSKRSAGEDGGSRPGHKRSRKGAAAKQSLLAKLRQNATQKEEEGGNAGGAKDAKKGSLKQAVLKTTLKQAVLKLKGKEDPKGKLGALKVMKTKAGAAGGLLARMMAKRAPRIGGSGPKEGGEDAAVKASAEPAEKEKKSADGSGAKGTNGALKPTKVVAGGLLARVIAAKEAKAPPAASAAPSSDPEAPAEEAGQDTPQRKRSNSAGASRSGSSGPPSTKKQKPPGKEGSAGKEAAKAKSSSKAGKSGSEEAKASTEETKAPSAGPTEGAAPEKSPEPAAPAPAPPAAAPAPAAAAPAPAAAAPVPAPTPSAAVAPAPPAAAAPAVPAAAAPAVPAAAPAMAAPAPRVVPETVRAAAAALGLSAASGSGSAGREAVNCQHFLLLANVMRTVEENPYATISTLADYFQVLLRMAETPELLLRTALDLLLPAGAAPQEAIEAAIAGAFGAAAGQTAKEKGLPEAAQEGRKAKRSLRAPPPRLTLPEVAEALAAARAGDGASLARALGATRPEGREAFFLVKALQGAAGASMGDVHAAVAKAMVCAAGAA